MSAVASRKRFLCDLVVARRPTDRRAPPCS